MRGVYKGLAMKRAEWVRRRIAVAVGFLGFCVAGIAFAADPAPKPAAGKVEGLRFRVLEVRGIAKWGALDLDPKSPVGWKRVQVGDEYGAGIQIATNVRSKVKLVMEPATPPTIVMIESMALASIDELAKRDEMALTRLGLAYGAIRAGVAESEVRSDLEIRSPVATLSKRGTWDFRLFVESGTGKFQMSLAERGLLEAIHNATGKRRYVLPGQQINQLMSRWVETASFLRPITVQDLFGLKGTEKIFLQYFGDGLGVITPDGDPAGVLNRSGTTADKLGGLGDLLNSLQNSNQSSQQLQLSQALQNRLGSGPGVISRPDGNFGVGFGNVPVYSSRMKTVQKIMKSMRNR